MEMKMRKVLVTPEMAQVWLDNARLNRSISKSHVQALRSEMAAGRWVPEQAPIRFDSDGLLWDGQHRLMALIQHGLPLYMFMQDQCSEDVVRSHGLTRGRTVEDQFRIDGTDSKVARSMAVLGKMLDTRRRVGHLPLNHGGNNISCGQVMDNLEWAGLTSADVLSASRDGNNIYQMRRDLHLAPGEWVYLYAQRAPGFNQFIDQIKNNQPYEPSAVAFSRYCSGTFSNGIRKDRRRMIALHMAFENRDLKKIVFRDNMRVDDLIGSQFPKS